MDSFFTTFLGIRTCVDIRNNLSGYVKVKVVTSFFPRNYAFNHVFTIFKWKFSKYFSKALFLQNIFFHTNWRQTSFAVIANAIQFFFTKKYLHFAVPLKPNVSHIIHWSAARDSSVAELDAQIPQQIIIYV